MLWRPRSCSKQLRIDAIHPNPVAETATLEFIARVAGHATIRVFDLLGREVLSARRIDVAPGLNRAGLDVRGAATGVYTIAIENGAVRTTHPVLIAR